MTAVSPPRRIIIHAIGSAGDVHPFIGIGVALKSRGHDVHVVTNPIFRDEILANQLGFQPLGTAEDFHRIKNNPDLWHPIRSFPALMRDAVDPSHEPILAISRELHQPGNTILIGSSLAFAARTASDLLDAPLATVHLAPSLFASVHHQPVIHGMPFGNRAPRFLKRLQWQLAGKVVDRHGLPGLNRFRRQHGLAPAKRLLHEWWHSPDRVIALFPDWFAAPQPDWPQQVVQTGFPLFDSAVSRPVPLELDEFLTNGEPPIIFTPGSAMAHGGAFFAAALGAVKKLGCRAVFLTPYRNVLPENLPDSIGWFPYAPFSVILPQCRLLVHHGGIGTCAQAMQAGVPQLIQPMAHDQFDTVARVRALGVGEGLVPRRFKQEPIAAAIGRLLGDPQVAANTKEVAGRFQPARWMDQTCAAIEACHRK